MRISIASFVLAASSATLAQSSRMVSRPVLVGSSVVAHGRSASSGQVSGWKTWIHKKRKVGALVEVDAAQSKEGHRALLIQSKEYGGVNVSQELFLPVGTTWLAFGAKLII